MLIAASPPVRLLRATNTPAASTPMVIDLDIMTIARPVQSRRLAAYVVAGLIVLVEIGGLELFAGSLRAFPFLLPIIAVTLVAFLGGSRPAILTAVVSELFVQYYVIQPSRSFTLVWPSGYLGVLFYALLCTIIISLMHGMASAHTALQINETSLQRLNDDLEQRVADRTADLVAAQGKLRHTNQNLENLVEAKVGDLRAANEEIQRFAYIVSHDLRAPLVNVLGFTSELEALQSDLRVFLDDVEARAPDLVTPDRRMAVETDFPEALGFIRSSTMKMDRLINAILKLSREGRRQLAADTIDVVALVTAQGETLSQQLSARGAELVIEGALPALVSDRLAVEQIFGNLIENAVKYLSPKRAGRIVVTGRAEGSILRYAVADNGRGIDARDFDRIFDLFRRAGEQDTAGEGIGLTYVRDLVRRLGGDVTVRSEYGVGSTFSVTFPSVFQVPAKEDVLDGVN